MQEERSRFLWILAGGAVVAGAVAGLAAWLGALSQPATGPLAGMLPVQPQAALGLAACGLGLVLAALHGAPRSAAVLCGGFATTLALLGLSRAAFGFDLGLEQLIDAVSRRLEVSSPAPLAVNAALGLGLAGAALVSAPRATLLRCMLGAGCAALGISAVLGYATEVHSAYGWGSSARIAPATATGLAILGLALGLLPQPGARSAGLHNWRLPLMAGVSCAVATVLFSQALSSHQERQLRQALESGAGRLRAEVRDRLHERMQALELLANIWKGRFFPDREAWESDADLIMSQSPGLRAIEWIEPSGSPDWVHPEGFASPPLRPASLESPEASAGAIVLGPLRLSGGRAGLRILVPLHVGGADQGWLSTILGDWDGWLAGVFDAHDLLSDLVAPLGSSYRIRIASGDLVFYESDGDGWDPVSAWTQEELLELPGGTRLAARLQPSAELLHAQQSPLPRVLLAGGLPLSVLLALGLGLANVSRERALQLEAEVADRQRAEREVRRLNDDLEERVRRRTRELSRSNDDLRRFAAFLSHELRQPVATQAIWAELLEANYASRLDDAGRLYLSRLRSFTGRIAESIEAQLALFSVTDAPLHLERVDLSGLLGALLAELKERLESQQAEVVVGELPPVHADLRLLRQLLANLLENAINYRRPEVPLRIRIDRGPAPLGATRYVEIVLEDNGRGFPAEDEERIFEPGCRVDSDRAGSGLGLTVCRRIAERHGGQLHAEGRPGAGARFRLVLPRALDEPDAPSA